MDLEMINGMVPIYLGHLVLDLLWEPGRLLTVILGAEEIGEETLRTCPEEVEEFVVRLEATVHLEGSVAVMATLEVEVDHGKCFRYFSFATFNCKHCNKLVVKVNNFKNGKCVLEHLKLLF